MISFNDENPIEIKEDDVMDEKQASSLQAEEISLRAEGYTELQIEYLLGLR